MWSIHLGLFRNKKVLVYATLQMNPEAMKLHVDYKILFVWDVQKRKLQRDSKLVFAWVIGAKQALFLVVAVCSVRQRLSWYSMFKTE